MKIKSNIINVTNNTERGAHLSASARLSFIIAAALGLAVVPFSNAVGDSSSRAHHSPGSPGHGHDEDDDDADRDDHPGDYGKGHGKGHRRETYQAGSSAGVAKGDFNGDGFADLAVGVPREDIPFVVRDGFGRPLFTVQLADAGAVNIIYGSAGGLTSTGITAPASQFWTQDSPGMLDTCEAGDRFGTALAAGDFNRDGFSDLAVAVPRETGPSNTEGAVQILYGSPLGLTSSGNQLFNLPQLFSSAVAESNSLRVGNSLVWGDFNGDGFGDLAVEGQNVGPDIARVSVLFGSATGLDRGATARSEFSFTNASAGGVEIRFTDLSFAAGRLNGDAFDDLVVGSPLEDISFVTRDRFGRPLFTVQFVDAGAVHILFGSVSGPTLSGNQVLHQNTTAVPDAAESFDNFAFAVSVGDFNGDGIGDLAAGVPFEDVDNFNEGAGVQPNFLVDAGMVHIFPGSSNGVATTGNQILRQGLAGVPGEDSPEIGDQFGFALAAGNFNDDGVIDLAIGAPGETLDSEANAGAVSVIYGAAGVGLSETAGPGKQFWNEESPGIIDTAAAGDRFGSSLTAWNFGRRQIVGIPVRIIDTADLAIGIPGKEIQVAGEIGGALDIDAGAVRVIYGSVSGLSTATGFLGAVGPSQRWSQTLLSDLDEPETGDGFGSALY